MMASKNENYQDALLLFFDFETTGLLDQENLRVLEASAALFDVRTWSVREKITRLLPCVTPAEWKSCRISGMRTDSVVQLHTKNMNDPNTFQDDYVRELHESTGLVHDLTLGLDSEKLFGWNRRIVGPDHPITHFDEDIKDSIQTVFTEHMDKGLDEPKLYLAGSGISEFDRPIIRQFMPILESMLHYRTIDFGVFRRAMAFLGHEIPWGEYPFDDPEHRASPDVDQSVAQMEWFKQRVRLDL